jgi:hypothetical protein
MRKPDRRTVLMTLAGTSIAGCASLNPLSNSDEGQTKLGTVHLANQDTTEHIVEFRVEWDGELVYDQAYEIEANDPDDGMIPGEIPERTWPDEPGQFTVSARLTGEEWQTIDPADDECPECLGVTPEVNPEGVLGLLASQNPTMCSDETIEAGQ